MKLKFIAKPPMLSYLGDESLRFADGEIQEVRDDVGKRLLEDFPNNFSELSKKELEQHERTEEKTAEAAEPPAPEEETGEAEEKEKAVEGSPSDKQVKSPSKKGGKK